jgi:hypothetical protein
MSTPGVRTDQTPRGCRLAGEISKPKRSHQTLP